MTGSPAFESFLATRGPLNPPRLRRGVACPGCGSRRSRAHIIRTLGSHIPGRECLVCLTKWAT